MINGAGVPANVPAAPQGSADDSLAQRLFGTNASQDTPPVLTNNTHAETLFGRKQEQSNLPELPPAIHELRNDPERKLFAETDFMKGELSAALKDTPGYDDVTKAAVVKEWGEILQDHGFSGVDARELINVAVAHAKQTHDEATHVEWAKDAERRLKEVYGSSADQALADARQLVKRDPRMAYFLEQTHLGNHPVFVMRLIEAARREKTKGRLR